MKHLITMLMLTGAAFGQNATSHSAATVASLHDSMLNPSTFVLDAVYLTKPDKHGNVTTCYEYRAQNRMGGMSSERATEDSKGRVSTYQVERGDDIQGYNAGWIAPCKAKNIDQDITKSVAAAAPALYRKDK